MQWGESLSSCCSVILGVIVLCILLVSWLSITAKRDMAREHRQIVRWAAQEQQEREDAQEEAEHLWSIIDTWEDVSSWFPFLPEPKPTGGNPEELTEACAKALFSLPSLGTFTSRHLAAPLLPPEERRRHLYVVGKTGSGKTTYLEHLMLADLKAGRGIGVMAPEGDLFRGRLLPMVSAARRKDVIYFAPGDPVCPLTFNPLSVEEGDDVLRAAEDLFTIFKRALSGDELGPRMQPILQNAFAILVGRPGMTLWDVKRLLTSPTFRSGVVKTTADPYIREFWEETFPRFSKGADLPLLSRLDHFLRPPAVRRSLCHPVSSFSIRQALSEGKVLLLDLFGLSEETRRLIGQMLLSKFQIELMRRELSGGAPPTFSLYCDEFQTFAGFAEGVWRELLSRGRKYGLALTLAHQYPAQLPTALQEEIFGNVNSMVAFGLGSKDAQVVRKELLTEVEQKGRVQLEPLPIEEILELRVGEAYAKLAGGRAVKLYLPAPIPIETRAAGEQVMAASWVRYAAPPIPEPEVKKPEEEEAPPPPPQTPPSPEVEQPREAPQQATPATPPPPKKESKKAPAPPPPLGRGGPEHQYLQELVKRLGEAKGFLVTIEESVLDGRGSVDVALSRDGWRLACEISVTTSVDHEVGNVEKCLAAGFDQVVVVSSNKRHIGKIRSALGKRLRPEELERVELFSPEELAGYLTSLPEPIEKVETVGGYQVKVSYRRPERGEGRNPAQAVAGVIARSLRKLRKED